MTGDSSHSPVQLRGATGGGAVRLHGFSHLVTDLLTEALRTLGVSVVDDRSETPPDVIVLPAPLCAEHLGFVDEHAPAARLLLVGGDAPSQPTRLRGRSEWLTTTSTVFDLASCIREGGTDGRRRRPEPSNVAARAPHPVDLTTRELEVVERVARGCTDDEVAVQLEISVHTVRSHLRRVREKLQVGSRFAVVAALRESGQLVGRGAPEVAGRVHPRA